MTHILQHNSMHALVDYTQWNTNEHISSVDP